MSAFRQVPVAVQRWDSWQSQQQNYHNGFERVMKRLLENAALVTDLDCDWHNLRNIRAFVPVPYPLIASDDPRMSDARLMIDGSVYNVSVAGDAGIQQSKLNLNGNIPPNYLLDPDGNVTTGDPENPSEIVFTVETDPVTPVTVGGITQQTYDEVVIFTDSGIEKVYGDDDLVVTVGLIYPPLHNYAARGDLVQYKDVRGQLNGYCPLGSDGRIPPAFYPMTSVGSVTRVELQMSVEFNVNPSVIDHGAGTLTTFWDDAPAVSWFGTSPSGQEEEAPGISLHPKFHTSQVPVALIPNLDASKIDSGVFNLSRLPYAKMGEMVLVPPPAGSAGSSVLTSTSAPGILPDTGEKGDPTDYVARDMTYKKMAPPPAYEPQVPDPAITYVSGRITITDSLVNAVCFYRLDFTGQFAPAPAGPFFVGDGVTVEAYAAKAGYQNSNIATFVVPPRPGGGAAGA
jgi:hypothetical protein